MIQVVVKQVDYDGETGRVTITFNPISIKRRAEHASKELAEAQVGKTQQVHGTIHESETRLAVARAK